MSRLSMCEDHSTQQSDCSWCQTPSPQPKETTFPPDKETLEELVIKSERRFQEKYQPKEREGIELHHTCRHSDEYDFACGECIEVMLLENSYLERQIALQEALVVVNKIALRWGHHRPLEAVHKELKKLTQLK